MALTEAVKIYGFGSYFSGEHATPGDIDLLVLHASEAKDSIDFAICCKRALSRAIPKVHITMLSEPEERDLSFRSKSNATFLSSVREDTISQNVQNILRIIEMSAGIAVGRRRSHR
jgi:hypothetical protein